MSSMHVLKRIRQLLGMVYSRAEVDEIFGHLMNLTAVYGRSESIRERRRKYQDKVVLNEQDSILIAYADTVSREGERPLRTLHRFLEQYVQEAVTIVHVLPFFPSSSDGGYAVVDYKKVDPRFGTWEDVRKLAKKYRLMVDLVMNHVSSQSEWFQGFLQGDKRYRDYFIWRDTRMEMPGVFRPRESPLFTEIETHMGKKFVWTTFSEDQVDLNYRSPKVLLRMIDVLLFYLSQGVEIIRLDAVGYVWKEANTSCVNLSKTHQIVRLLRSILEYVAPYAVLVTEANFPYEENVAYFGEGHEANMVYKFSLPPLVLDAFARKDTSNILREKKRLRKDLLFLNFLASHDGIALLSAKEVLPKVAFENLLRITAEHGGFVSYKSSHGRKSPYELNISYFDAINGPNGATDPLRVRRFLASQAIMLALKGILGIYIHSLLGSRNYRKGVRETGSKRMINRKPLHDECLSGALSDRDSLRYEVWKGYLHMLRVRRRERAFHPRGSREMVDLDERLFAIERQFQGEEVFVVINVSEDTIRLPEYRGKFDLYENKSFEGEVGPYGVHFLKETMSKEKRNIRISD